MKKKTKIMIAGTTVAVLAAAVGGTVILTSATDKVGDAPEIPNTVTVERMDLTNKVALSGKVKSADIATVKCSLTDMKVKSVNVKVGDEVKKGDIIAVLDDSDLKEKLAEAEKKLKITKTKNEIELSAADRSCESTISASDRSLKDAEKAIKDAQKTYDEAVKKDNDIYKEYLDALEDKNKAYDKFKPYEKKVKDDDKTKKQKQEKEEEYSKACEKLAQTESELAAEAEGLAKAEAALREAGSKLEAARSEYSRQTALRQEAQAKLSAVTAPAETDDTGTAPDGGNGISALIGTYDSSVSAAETVLAEAEAMFKDAQTAYDSAAKEYNKVSKEQLKASEEKSKAYSKYKDFLSNDGSEKGIELENKYKEAKEKFEQKEKELKEANEKVEDARDDLNKQKELKKAAEEKKDKDRADIEGSYESTMLTVDEGTASQKKEIKKLKEDIEKCTITATAGGVITSLGIKTEDTFMGGEVAVIQNTDEFIISANADQYEIAKIEKGMPTRITVSALGEEQMEGTLSFAAPTPETKDSQGGQTTEYPIESEILEPMQGMRLGMNAKLEIISEEKTDVLAVPDECIQVDENGDYYVEAVDETGAVTHITVNYGMKGDYYSEIEGDGITEGMQIVMPEQQLETDNEMMMLF